jgi:spoIIIJ-associated protein
MIEASGGTREEALRKAAEMLGVPADQVEVVLLEEKRRRFLGLFGGPLVRVRARRATHAGGAGSVGRERRDRRGRPGPAGGPRDAAARSDAGADADRTREIVEGILSAMRIDGAVSVEKDGSGTRVQVRTEASDGLLIGRHGQTLLALEHIAHRILTKARDDRPVVPIDVGGYRLRGGEPRDESHEVRAVRHRAGRSRSRRRVAGAAGAP